LTTDFELWLGANYPRATVHSSDGSLQRLTVGFYDTPISPGALAVLVAKAWQCSTWSVSSVNWRLRADGGLSIHAVEYVRGMP